MSFLTTIQSGFSSVKNVTAEHSPQILMAAGVASIVGGIVLTIKNNTRASDILIDRSEAIRGLNELHDDNPDQYTEEMVATDIRKVNLTSSIGLVKTYAPGVLLTATGIVEMVLAHRELTTRYQNLMSYTSSLATAFAAYRQRAKEIYGEDADDRIMYGKEKKKVTIREVDPETGEEKTHKEEVDVCTNPFGVSQYAVYFDKDTTSEFDENDDQNLGYILGCQSQANDRLQCSRFHIGPKKKILTLNEVYEMLGFPQTVEGSIVGWSLDSKDGDHQVIFNVQKVAREDYDGADTYHKCYLIDFNVDGPVTNQMISHNFNKQKALESKA